MSVIYIIIIYSVKTNAFVDYCCFSASITILMYISIYIVYKLHMRKAQVGVFRFTFMGSDAAIFIFVSSLTGVNSERIEFAPLWTFFFCKNTLAKARKIPSYIYMSFFYHGIHRHMSIVKHFYLAITEFWQYWCLKQRALKYKSCNIWFSRHIPVHTAKQKKLYIH